jgi:hypothetical protein
MSDRQTSVVETAQKRSLRELSLLVLNSPLAAWLIAVLGTMIGGWLELDSDRIRTSSKSFLAFVFQSAHGDVDLRTTAFWIVCALWTLLLGTRLQMDGKAAVRRDLTLIRTIHRWPDVAVLHSYTKEYYDQVQLACGPYGLTEAPQTAEDAAQRVVQVLDVIAGLARRFSKVSDASYGANVMLVAGHEAFPALRKQVRFVQDDETMDGAKGLLYLPQALLLTQQKGDQTRAIPLIALPIPKSEVTNNGFNCVIPGAPAALFRTNSVHEDTHTITKECAGLTPDVIHQMELYFRRGGAGQAVRSFASFRLGSMHDPIGVLNIDSNRTHVLGTEPSEYIAFYALLEPLLTGLRLLVKEYAELAGAPTLDVAAGVAEHTVTPRAVSGP